MEYLQLSILVINSILLVLGLLASVGISMKVGQIERDIYTDSIKGSFEKTEVKNKNK